VKDVRCTMASKQNGVMSFAKDERGKGAEEKLLSAPGLTGAPQANGKSGRRSTRRQGRKTAVGRCRSREERR